MLLLCQAIIASLLGAVCGSFYGALFFRAPKLFKNPSKIVDILCEPSTCQRCQTRVSPWSNIPVLSYWFLRGTSRCCQQPLSLFYAIFESLVAVFSGVAIVMVGPEAYLIWFFPAFGSGSLLVVLLSSTVNRQQSDSSI